MKFIIWEGKGNFKGKIANTLYSFNSLTVKVTLSTNECIIRQPYAFSQLYQCHDESRFIWISL